VRAYLHFCVTWGTDLAGVAAGEGSAEAAEVRVQVGRDAVLVQGGPDLLGAVGGDAVAEEERVVQAHGHRRRPLPQLLIQRPRTVHLPARRVVVGKGRPQKGVWREPGLLHLLVQPVHRRCAPSPNRRLRQRRHMVQAHRQPVCVGKRTATANMVRATLLHGRPIRAKPSSRVVPVGAPRAVRLESSIQLQLPRQLHDLPRRRHRRGCGRGQGIGRRRRCRVHCACQAVQPPRGPIGRRCRAGRRGAGHRRRHPSCRRHGA
jgi:hypothetical protein